MLTIDESRALLLLHAAATLFMTGLIWFVQLVHYPLLRQVGTESLQSYAQGHGRRTTFVVGPAMLVEASTAIAIAWWRPWNVSYGSAALGLALLLLIWLSTAFLQVPAHTRLRAADRRAIDRLVGTNWLRTAAWSVRAVVALLML